jgi:hypothetical protein
MDTERILIGDGEFTCLGSDTSVSDGFSACNSCGMQVEPTPQGRDGVRSTWRCAPPTAAYCRLLPRCPPSVSLGAFGGNHVTQHGGRRLGANHDDEFAHEAIGVKGKNVDPIQVALAQITKVGKDLQDRGQQRRQRCASDVGVVDDRAVDHDIWGEDLHQRVVVLPLNRRAKGFRCSEGFR